MYSDLPFETYCPVPFSRAIALQPDAAAGSVALKAGQFAAQGPLQVDFPPASLSNL